MAYPNTFSDLQTEVINRLRLDSTNDLTKVKDAINRAYADMVVSCEALAQSATMALTASTDSYTLPSGIVRIKWMVAAPAGSTRYEAPLTQLSLEDLLLLRRAQGALNTYTAPTYSYALAGENQLEVYPMPTAADVILIYYTYQPTALSGSSDVPSAVPEPYTVGIVEGACAALSDFVKDGNVLTYQGLFEQTKQRFRVHLNRRRGSGASQLRVGNTDVYVPHDPSTDIR